MRVLLPTTAAVIAVVAALLAPAPAAAAGPEIGGYGDDYFLNDGWSGTANQAYDYGLPGDGALVGDWDGDGVDTLGVRRGIIYLLADAHGPVAPAHVISYGWPDDVTLVGDWNGDGRDTLAVRRGRTYYLNDSLSGGEASAVIRYGREGDEVILGDWDGDGVDTLGVRRGNRFYLRNTLEGGEADIELAYGKPDDIVYVGDWDGDGRDTPAVRRGAQYFIANSFAGGEADRVLRYGRAGDATLVGDWNRDGADTLGVRRGARPSAHTVSWADGTYGAFAPATTRGHGSDSVSVPSSARRGLVTITSTDRALTVDAIAADGSATRLIGGIAGARTAVWGDPRGGDIRSLRVTSSASWVLTSHPVGSAEAIEGAGSGPEVFLYGGAGGTLRASHLSGGAVSVAQNVSAAPAPGRRAVLYPDAGRQVISGLSAGSASGALAAGPAIVRVEGGEWALNLPAPPPAPSSTAEPPAVSYDSVVFPLSPGYRVGTRAYQPGVHNGVDLLDSAWTPIHAIADGVVYYSGWTTGGYGYLVTIRHRIDGELVETRSAHMVNVPPVTPGQVVKAGQIIGYMGSTGNSTANHLHLEIRTGVTPNGGYSSGELVDPMEWLPAEG